MAERPLVVRRIFVGGIAAVFAAACSLTTDLDGFAVGTKDAGPRPSDGGATDGTTTSSVDSSAAFEAGADAAPRPECPDKPVSLCEEFESDEKKNGWQVTQAGGATVAPATAPWGEHGLVVTIPKAESGDIPNAFWAKKFSPQVSKLTLDLDLQYDQIPTNAGEYHNTLAVRVDHGDTYNIVYLSIGTASIGYVVQDFPGHDGDIDYRGLTLPPGVRHHVHVEIAAGGASRIAIDGEVKTDHPAPAFFRAGQPTLLVGITLSGVPSTPMTMGYAHLAFSGE